jgi:hypothetical protein
MITIVAPGLRHAQPISPGTTVDQKYFVIS